MDDGTILQLFWQRSETAIEAVNAKYGTLCRSIAMNLLRNAEDAEECVNDTFLALWNQIPPKRPLVLRPFVAKITRNLAMKRLTGQNAQKRTAPLVPMSELDSLIPGGVSAEQGWEERELVRLLEQFLRGLDEKNRFLFLRRYWFCDSVEQIAAKSGMSAGSVKTRLCRIREKLKVYLEKEGNIYVG